MNACVDGCFFSKCKYWLGTVVQFSCLFSSNFRYAHHCTLATEIIILGSGGDHPRRHLSRPVLVHDTDWLGRPQRTTWSGLQTPAWSTTRTEDPPDALHRVASAKPIEQQGSEKSLLKSEVEESTLEPWVKGYPAGPGLRTLWCLESTQSIRRQVQNVA